MRSGPTKLEMLTFLFLLTFAVETRNTASFTFEPFGPKLCKELCKSFDVCTVPDYSEKRLNCKLETGKEWKKFIRNREELKNVRVITSRALVKIAVCTFIRKPVKGYSVLAKQLQESTADSEFLGGKILAIDGSGNARMQSMTKSIICPNILYILLKMKNTKSCNYAVRLLNKQNKDLLPNEIDCCQTRSKNKQIFTGLCVITMETDCLYILHIGFKIKLFGYKEPCQADSSLQLEYEAEIEGMLSGKLACFLYKTPIFFCLRNGKVYSITAMVKHEVVTPVLHAGRLPGHFAVQDIAVDPSFTCIIIVSNFRVTLAQFHFPQGTLSIIRDIRAATQTVTWIDNTVLIHSSHTDTPFYRCSKQQFVSGECNLLKDRKIYFIMAIVKHEGVTPVGKATHWTPYRGVQDIAVDPSFNYVIIVFICRVTLPTGYAKRHTKHQNGRSNCSMD